MNWLMKKCAENRAAEDAACKTDAEREALKAERRARRMAWFNDAAADDAERNAAAADEALKAEMSAKYPAEVLELGRVWSKGGKVRLYLSEEQTAEKVFGGLSRNKTMQLRGAFIDMVTGKVQAPDWAQEEIADFIEDCMA